MLLFVLVVMLWKVIRIFSCVKMNMSSWCCVFFVCCVMIRCWYLLVWCRIVMC